VPATDPIGGRTLVVVPPATPPAAGQLLVLSGRAADQPEGSDPVTEVAVVELASLEPLGHEPVTDVAIAEFVPAGPGQLRLRLARELEHDFDPTDLTICANVAPSTHGETVETEVLGSGDGSATFQRFALKRSPLTFVPASTPSGATSTLEVRVNGVAWAEAPTLYGLGPRDERYVVRVDDAQRATVVGGDGGSRLPTGQENVAALPVRARPEAT
jgi:hypothetical protein